MSGPNAAFSMPPERELFPPQPGGAGPTAKPSATPPLDPALGFALEAGAIGAAITACGKVMAGLELQRETIDAALESRDWRALAAAAARLHALSGHFVSALRQRVKRAADGL